MQSATASLRATTTPWRATSFSTTSAALKFTFPPESPRFINVDEPPQSSEPRLPFIKGHLPVPRQVFDKRDGKRKVSSQFLEASTPLSRREVQGLPPISEVEARHREHAAKRRTALGEGIKGLWARKRAADSVRSLRARANKAANKAARWAPEREDDVLTRPSVHWSTAHDTAVQVDPERFEKAEQARAQHAEMLAAKADERRYALSQLYIAARDFIVDEKQLEAAVEVEFRKDKFSEENSNYVGTSIWADGAPVTVMKVQRDKARSEAWNSPQASVAAERQMTTAEELTGGKL